MGRNKKKIDTELSTYFPGYFGNDIDFLENLRQWYILRAELEINPNDKDAKALDTIYRYFQDRNRPQCFNPHDENSVLIQGEQEFEEICNSMEDAGMRGIKEATVFEFYSKVQFLEKKARKMKSLERT